MEKSAPVNWEVITSSMKDVEQLIEKENWSDMSLTYKQLELDLYTYFKSNNSSEQLKETISWHENISKVIAQLRRDSYEKIKICDNKRKINEEYNKNY